jgi:pyruvate dehydrogenase E2 component (dihydrolipoamide acetyltransferase)
MESGVVLHWLKVVGDTVAKGDDLAEIETDKVNVVMEAPAAGVLRKLLIEAGTSVPCDTILAVLTATADEPLDGAAGVTPVNENPAPQDPQPAAADVVPALRPLEQQLIGSAAIRPQPEAVSMPAPNARAHINASPAAKNLAKNLGVDLAGVSGTGPQGRIGLEDVQRAAAVREQARKAPAATVTRRMPISKMRATIAHRMLASTSTAPQFTERRRVDMSRALELRKADGTASSTPVPGVVDVLHLAVVRALGVHPEVNASFEPGESLDRSHIVLHGSVNLGIAVTLPEGLIVPVIHDAQTLSLKDLAAQRVRLQAEARAGRLSAQSLSGATFTVSNLGTLNVDEFTAIVNPPEAAILAVGRMQLDLVVRDGAIYTLPMLSLTVTADHRVLDGAQVAHFLETLTSYLEHPETLP